MIKTEAIKLVRETFESPFDKTRYIKFARNLLNEYESAEITRTGNLIPDAFQDYVSKYERLGKYVDDEEHRIDILIVHLKKETSIERARSMQRNFIAGYLQGHYGTDSEKDAALVAFVSPDSQDWRFSLVKLDVRLEATPKGGMKPVDEFTPARRWSFLVGVHEKSHTAQSRLVPIISDDEQNPTLDELEEAFNIEKVTKEFFEKYRDLFIRAKSELDKTVAASPKTKADFGSKGIDTVNLAKKLLGQIIFLYYLQKKGWFGVPRDGEWGEGSKNFLRELFEKKHGDYKNFFNDILEPLFYEALRNDRSNVDHYYSRFDCKIPFLNGGLFDPMNNYDWVKTELLLSNELFHNNNKTREGDSGDGILDIFDRYNFTVKEDEPFEKEVAIDPELLGKAYEKFNAIRPDNYREFLTALKSGKKGEESKFNRQYGVYYTPREIVHYMCQQSLINYLASEFEGKATKEDIAMFVQTGENLREHEAQAALKETKTYSPKLPDSIRQNAVLIDQKLAGIKVCDPAVGSGAFPVGMMSEIVKTRQALAIYQQTFEVSPTGTMLTTYDFKRHCIEHSLYGVDIDPGAVEIAKLRLWLSLIVDEDDPKNIKPLPNLDYKVVQGNSLIEILTENYLATDADTERTKFLKQLKNAKDDLFNLTSPNQKEQKRREIEDLMQALFENYRDRQIRKLKEKLLGLKGSVRLAGFSDIKILKSDQAKVQAIEKQIKGIENLGLPDKTEHFEWRIIFSEVFEQNSGFDVVIGNPPYIEFKKVDHTTKQLYSKFETAKGKYDVYILFIEVSCRILKNAGFFCFINPNTFMKKDYGEAARKFILKNFQIEEIHDFGDIQVFENAMNYTGIFMFLANQEKRTYSFRYHQYKNAGRNIVDQELSESLNSISLFKSILVIPSEKLSNNIWNFQNNINNALLDKISSISKPLSEFTSKIFEGIASGKDEVFYIHKDDMQESKIEKEIAFPLLRGKDVKPYTINWAGFFVIYPYDKDSKPLAERTLSVNFPNAYSYLKKYKKLLAGRSYFDNSGKLWYELWNQRKRSNFETLRIITPEIANRNSFALTDKHFGNTKTYHIILLDESKDNYRFFLGVLNSQLLDYIYKLMTTHHAGGYFAYKTQFLENVPIPNIDNVNRKPIVSLVNRILEAKGGNPQAVTSALEGEIDQLVYQLYGLSEDEVKIVEGKNT